MISIQNNSMRNIMVCLWLFLLNLLLLAGADELSSQVQDPVQVENFDFWRQQGFQNLRDAVTRQSRNENKARNVIIFVGDGMGSPTVAAGRIFKAQQSGHPFPERSRLVFEEFPHLGHSVVR